MRLHATAGPGHAEALDRFIDDPPLDDDQESLIDVSAAHTGASFAYCLSDLQPWETARAVPSRKQSPGDRAVPPRRASKRKIAAGRSRASTAP